MEKDEKRIREVSIKRFLRRDNEILLLKTAGTIGKWELPGGRAAFGESVEETLRREMKEELGFEKVGMGKLMNSWTFTDMRNGTNYHYIIFDFEIFSNESKIKLSDEHAEYRWTGKNDFEKLNIREGHKETLRACLKSSYLAKNS